MIVFWKYRKANRHPKISKVRLKILAAEIWKIFTPFFYCGEYSYRVKKLQCFLLTHVKSGIDVAYRVTNSLSLKCVLSTLLWNGFKVALKELKCPKRNFVNVTNTRFFFRCKSFFGGIKKNADRFRESWKWWKLGLELNIFPKVTVHLSIHLSFGRVSTCLSAHFCYGSSTRTSV